jgi:hypothetical protein
MPLRDYMCGAISGSWWSFRLFVDALEVLVGLVYLHGFRLDFLSLLATVALLPTGNRGLRLKGADRSVLRVGPFFICCSGRLLICSCRSSLRGAALLQPSGDESVDFFLDPRIFCVLAEARLYRRRNTLLFDKASNMLGRVIVAQLFPKATQINQRHDVVTSLFMHAHVRHSEEHADSMGLLNRGHRFYFVR